jgi:hypothetical protein
MGHGFATGTRVVIAGTANYDGVYAVNAASTANEIVIAAAYVADVLPAGATATALVVTVV